MWNLCPMGTNFQMPGKKMRLILCRVILICNNKVYDDDDEDREWFVDWIDNIERKRILDPVCHRNNSFDRTLSEHGKA